MCPVCRLGLRGEKGIGLNPRTVLPLYTLLRFLPLDESRSLRNREGLQKPNFKRESEDLH